MREVVCKAIDAVEFSFYTEEEIHAISVKQITSPVLFDNLKNAVPGGLYDPALGPLDKFSSCITCGQQPISCPGHCGHIKLMLPVYNPLVYKNVLKIYRSICTFCHHFKMSRNRVALFAEKLDLISQGRMVEAMDVVVKKSENDDLKDGVNVEEEESFATGLTEEVGEDIGSSKFRGDSSMEDAAAGKRHFTASQVSAIKDVINQFLNSMPTRKCENCLGNVPSVRNEGVGKLFQVPLPKNQMAANIMKGLRSVINIGSGDNTVKSAKDEDVEMEESEFSGSAIQERDEGKKKEQNSGSDDIDFRNTTKFITPSEVKEHLRLVWENEQRICSLIWGAQEAFGLLQRSKKDVSGSDMFFLRTLLVTPNRFRPPNRMDDQVLEHPQNVMYSRVIQSNISLTEASRGANGDLNFSKATALWLNLQNAVNALLDSTTAIGGGKADGGGNGVRQLLEKKDGLFRMNMMGKRVNFACRSVISPDPYIAVNEIGIPPYFATRLTYPERVTPWNVQQLRDAVENGPSAHPGATHVEDEDGKLTNLASLPKFKRAAIAKTLLSASGVSGSNVSRGTDASSDVPRSGGKTVYRHLRTGDILLVNRQPTLHKPGVMAHKARVLKGEKTLRMHYANCSTYNADFDGDEMNVHFPQDELGRSEGYNIVNADEQFVVPTSGDPIRGLIQDHVVGAVLLTKRDTFLTKEEYMQIVYTAIVSSTPPTLPKKKSALGMVERDRPIRILPPAIYKPRRLWTGKQVMTTIFNYITQGSPPFSMSAGGKTPKEYWGHNSGENIVLLQDNELICGVIDKAQFGKYGLVHAFQELYGCSRAGKLLSIFSRLFTNYLQMHGFTCGIGDLLLVPRAEKDRRHKLRKADKLGDSVHAKFVGFKEETEADIDVDKVKSEVEKLLRVKGEPASNRLDRMMSGALNGVTSEVNNAMFPKGLMKAFPGNNFTMMTVTGAKGGLVNFTQISSLLGQQELEGKRVPRMVSGKTLPCFSPWDTGARAGGFIGDRFLSGLRPQEYYFHCMAGRDGLVDTAVKTSRSGYLQRCLVKNLEGLKIHYDYTVRDSDGSIVQFKYGEDGIDVLKTSYLTKFELLADNQSLVSRKLGKDELESQRPNEGEASGEDEMSFGGVSVAFNKKVDEFLKGLPKKELRRLNLRKTKYKDNFRLLMQLKFITSLAPPGEPVGVLAAQSVGEPSTQMTLNTFHFAGRGEMNVTLGIPRLREILMTASENISTPIMTCPLRSHLTKEDGELLAMRMRRLRLVDLIEKVDVGEVPFSVQQGLPKRVYKIKLKLYSPKRFPAGMNLTLKECERIIREEFIPKLEKEVSKGASRGASKKDVIGFVPLQDLGEGEGATGDDDEDGAPKAGKGKDVDVGEQAEDDEDEEGDEEGADAEKRRSQGTDERGYADEEDEDEKAIANDLLKEDDLTREDLEENEEDDGAKDQQTTAEAGGSKDVQSTSETIKMRKPKTPKKGDEGMLTMQGSTVEMQFTSSQQSSLVLMPELVEKVAKQVSVRAVKGIDKCSVIETKDKKNPDGPPLYSLQTDGVNLEGFWALHDELDVNNLTTNNIATILRVYGVEAARQTIMSEVLSVFGSYGIGVNPRHLSLISDFMTSQGGYRPCNRLGIYSSPSPFLKMSYETATTFLMDATLKKQSDNLTSPSSRIVLGRVVESGTGSFELLQKIDEFIESKG
ncbi:hypothetical protein R1flu_002439 [Riccia fluitans]|uniref:DNA-directed RNA polymerase subunit n=1 Tax=Riccia fluitans TaxID=41844 RepID=A0ABD1Y9Y7_9MARC